MGSLTATCANTFDVFDMSCSTSSIAIVAAIAFDVVDRLHVGDVRRLNVWTLSVVIIVVNMAVEVAVDVERLGLLLTS